MNTYATYAVGNMTRSSALPIRVLPPAQSLRIYPMISRVLSAGQIKTAFHKRKDV